MALLNVVLDPTKKCELKPDTYPDSIYLYQEPVLSCGDPGSWASYDGTCYYRTITTPAIPPSTTIHTISGVSNSNYSLNGTIFYNSGYTIDGNGTGITVTTNDIWKNNTGTNGPMIRSQIWTNLTAIGSDYQPNNTWVGVVACVTGTTTSKIYYVGIAGDNEYKLMIDGNLIVDSYYYLGAIDDTHHKFWHVYPVSILAGQHQLHLFGMNRGLYAAFACVVYDNTLAELTGATLLSQLNVIFDSRAQTDIKLIQLQDGTYINSGYTCTTGSYLACNNTCIDIEICCPTGITTTTTSLPPTTTTTSTSSSTSTTTTTFAGTTTTSTSSTTTAPPPPTYYGYVGDQYTSGSTGCIFVQTRTVADIHPSLTVGRYYLGDNGIGPFVFHINSSGADISGGGFLITNMVISSSTCIGLLPFPSASEA